MANQPEKTVKPDKGEFMLNVKGGEELRSEVYLLIIRFMLLSAIKVMAALCLKTFSLSHNLHMYVNLKSADTSCWP